MWFASPGKRPSNLVGFWYAVPKSAWRMAPVSTSLKSPNALTFSSYQIEPGTSLPVLPKSSGCSRIVRPGQFSICAASTRVVKSTKVFASLVCSRAAPRNHGNPRGNFLDRTGLGPWLLALRERENEPHGGDDAVRW